MRARKIAATCIVIFVLFATALLVLPWQGLVQQKIIRVLADKGFTSSGLTIDHIGLRGLVLKDVSLGEPPIKLATLMLGYAPRALLKGQIEDVTLTGLDLRAVENDSGWRIEGMQAVASGKGKDGAISIPVTLAQLSRLPFRSISLADAQLSIIGKGWQAMLPISGRLQHRGDATLHLESSGANATLGEDHIALGAITIDLALDDAKQQWLGNWSIKDMVTTSEKLTVPLLQARGELRVESDSISTTAQMNSADRAYNADLKVNYDFTKPETSTFSLERAAMPLSGGTISVHNLRVPFKGTAPIALTLELQHIAVDSVMAGLTGSKARGTGAVSGSIPVTIRRDGVVRVGNTALAADGPGTIVLAPEVIPGDNPQVALVRDVMKNLHYSVLALGLDMAPDGQLKAVLVVEGTNPEVERGRAVKLKVQLSGDLLDLLLQNLKLMTDPKTFIEQHSYEKP